MGNDLGDHHVIGLDELLGRPDIPSTPYVWATSIVGGDAVKLELLIWKSGGIKRAISTSHQLAGLYQGIGHFNIPSNSPIPRTISASSAFNSARIACGEACCTSSYTTCL